MLRSIAILLCFYIIKINNADEANVKFPIVINTWPDLPPAEAAWQNVSAGGSALDGVEVGCSKCEELQCRGSVGFGGRPDENSETTLDAMIMDGETHDVGAVGCLREIKSAISVARMVLERTDHTMLVGSLATDFAVMMGFKKENLSTLHSISIYDDWRKNRCQPNHWKNVVPNPTTTCGPYEPARLAKEKRSIDYDIMKSHDTIAMIAIDKKGRIAAGTTTNGLSNKIPGRVGDSPIAGSGAYVDKSVGSAAATGNGDVMMRFAPSIITVEYMRQGFSPSESARIALKRIVPFYPKFSGAIISVRKTGEYGAACVNLPNGTFRYVVGTRDGISIKSENCLDVAALGEVKSAAANLVSCVLSFICVLFQIFLIRYFN